MEKICKEKNIKSSLSNNSIKQKNNILILVPHEPHLDPRNTWLKEGFDHFANVNIVGTTYCPENNIKWRINSEHIVEANLNYSGLTKLIHEYEENIYSDYYDLKRLLTDFCINDGLKFPESSFYSIESINRFQWYCGYFNKTDQALRFVTDQIINSNSTLPDLLVCCDLSSLLPGIILAQKYKIPLVYDAHEFWAYSDVMSLPWEIDFWLHFERVLLKYVNFPITVSKTLAKKMSKTYLTNFSYLPNAETIKNNLNLEKGQFKVELFFDDCDEFPDLANNAIIKFLYMGGYAPGRGLEQLIDVWRSVSENNKLILRGVHWEYTDSLIERAKKYGLYNKTVFFFKPVKEFELVSMASTFDIGIIPYDQNTNAAYKYCCPNKLSQYMAAGIPILSNQLIEVERVINKANCGFTVNFNFEQELLDIINRFSDINLRKKMGNAARDYFVADYNWEKQVEPLNYKLKKLMKEKNNAGFLTINIHNLPETSETSETSIFLKLYHIPKHLITRKIMILNPILRKIKANLS